ncbi:MAG: LLM class flavin-dependent oxidoreductase [Deltaproteobacteria bacterium]|nr:LLM class flavin-dependent oxidoreductase [Deltaproteobacteria bacterium]
MSLSFGLFVNCGAPEGRDDAGVLDLAVAQADHAERLGYDQVWLTEHHFIRFGINPSALAFAGYLLGRTQRIRVGTAVTLAPLYHPLQLAEQAALLDQLSNGRFDFGLGRGGYRRDFEEFEIDSARWGIEVERTLSALERAWAPGSDVLPRPRTQPFPPLYVASTTPASLDRAARIGAPLLHYFATPLDARAKVEAAYREAARAAEAPPQRGPHVHSFVCAVSDDAPATRAAIRDYLTRSFRDGDHPHVGGAASRGRHGPEGAPRDNAALANGVADAALIGTPAELVRAFETLRDEHGVRNAALYVEPCGERSAVLETVSRFATEVMPRLSASQRLRADHAP